MVPHKPAPLGAYLPTQRRIIGLNVVFFQIV